MNEIMETPVYKDFVHPMLCRDLMIAGLDVALPCFWNVHEKAHLRSYTFDAEDYYRLNDIICDDLNPPLAVFPAFQVGDLDKLVPDYFISRTNGDYMISLGKIYGLSTVTADRLPDLFAKMVLLLMQKRILTTESAIQILTQKKAA